ncbi:MAG: hypothetical protein XD91_0468, partial [Clostridiales bacterium 38_11]
LSRLTTFSPNLVVTKNIINLMYNHFDWTNQLSMVLAGFVFGIAIIFVSTILARKGEFR